MNQPIFYSYLVDANIWKHRLYRYKIDAVLDVDNPQLGSSTERWFYNLLFKRHFAPAR